MSNIKKTKTIDLTFFNFHLKEEIILGIYELGYKTPSPIQKESVPIILLGKNVLVRAKSGTGKTSAYLIPSLHTIDVKQAFTQVLVLVPIRELAFQTSYACKKLGKYIKNLTIMVTTGGIVVKNNITQVHQMIHVLIGTPTRVGDLLKKILLKYQNVKF